MITLELIVVCEYQKQYKIFISFISVFLVKMNGIQTEKVEKKKKVRDNQIKTNAL